MKVIGVRFKSTKKIYYFNPNGLEIQKGDNVVVDTSRGIEFGQTVIGIKEVDENDIVQPLQNVVRIATPEDEKAVADNEAKRADALEKCQQKIEKHSLDMKLVDAEFTFDGTKLIFYFTSEGRVDFRDLVKDLAVLFRTRIELRQIAVRDETKILGGLGACGNEICCKKFLGDFASVSIKMAKDQGISLNPTKISGLCGRLICCLNYEKNFYTEMNEILPSVGEIVVSPKGQAEVVQTFPLKESVKVKYTNPDGSTDTCVFKLPEITRTHEFSSNNAKNEEENNPELEKLVEETVQTDSAETNKTENSQTDKKPKNERKPFDKPKFRRETATEEKQSEDESIQSDEKSDIADEANKQQRKKDFRKDRQNRQPKHQQNSDGQTEGEVNEKASGNNTEHHKANGKKFNKERHFDKTAGFSSQKNTEQEPEGESKDGQKKARRDFKPRNKDFRRDRQNNTGKNT